MKKIPMRTCVVTHTKADKRDLLRIVRTKEGNVLVDITGKLNGKGAYILKDLTVLEKAKKIFSACGKLVGFCEIVGKIIFSSCFCKNIKRKYKNYSV